MNSNGFGEPGSTDSTAKVGLHQPALSQTQCTQTWGCGADYIYKIEKFDETNKQEHLVSTV